MESDLSYLRAAVVEALTLLQADAAPLAARAFHAQAVLRTALWRLGLAQQDAAPTLQVDPLVMPAGAEAGDNDDDLAALPRRTLRSLSDERRERRMTIPQFTAWLGIAHHEYAAVVQRRLVDRRLRDQIAFTLGVAWHALAECMPEPPLPPRPRPRPLPPSDDAPPPDEPWFLVDAETGAIVSGPDHAPLPANAGYRSDPLRGGPTNLVVIVDRMPVPEEALLLLGGYSAAERARIDDDENW